MEILILKILPAFILFSFGIIAILWSFLTNNNKHFSYITILGGSISFIFLIFNFGNVYTDTLFVFDDAGTIFSILFVFIMLIIAISSMHFDYSHPEIFYSLLMFSTGAMILAAYSNNLISIFITFEASSLSTYVLASYPKSRKTLESSMKFFVIGALSSAFIIFGISFYFISTNTFMLGVVSNSELFLLSLILLLVGFGFKLSLFPFHSWAIDTYTGARSPVAALLSTSSKLMALAIMVRIFIFTFDISLSYYVQLFFIIISILTMTYGNVTALVQKDVKRMLAYSSVANAGYISLIFTITTNQALSLALSSILLFSMAYILMKGGAFLTMEDFESSGSSLESMAGLGKKRPLLALSFAILLFSLAGIPPTLGFMGKYFLFLSLIEGNLWWLAIIAVLNSAISVYYYFRVIMYMYWKDSTTTITYHKNVEYAVFILSILTIVVGILTPFIFGYIHNMWFVGGVNP
ncbi:MAG: NADH-quinone oxidoreductase subunit N [Thermoplasmata archaeon]